MEAGGSNSKRNENPSRAAAYLQTAAGRSPLRVILVEPRDLVRDCVAICLRVADPGLAVVGYSSVHDVDAKQSADAIALILSFFSRGIPDLAAAVGRAQDHIPKVPIVVVGDNDELSFVRKVISLGVRGYIPTSFDFATFKEAIQFVAAGGTFVPASVLLQHAVEQMSDIDETDALVKNKNETYEVIHQNWNETQERMVAANFTPRELAVISHLRDGKSNKLIARELAICEGTVKVHIRRIMKKLQVENRTQAALLAIGMELAG